MSENDVYIQIRPGVTRRFTKEELSKLIKERKRLEELQEQSYLKGQSPAIHFNMTKPYTIDNQTYDSIREYEKAADKKGLYITTVEESRSVARKNKIENQKKREIEYDKQLKQDIYEVVNDFDLTNKI
jgi:hypothetical protein